MPDARIGGSALTGPRRIMVSARVGEELRRQLEARFPIVLLSPGAEEETVARYGDEVDLLVTSSNAGFASELMERMPNLRAIVIFGAGFDKIDVGAARARGIKVSNTPDVTTDCVADVTVGLLICVMRGIVSGDRFVRDGDWQHSTFPLTTAVHGKSIGILGLGRIGSAVAARLRNFDVGLAYHARTRRNELDLTYCGSVVELARRCDALLVTVPGNEDTRSLVSSEVLEALGPAGYLVNVSRGSVVDMDALIHALSSGLIGGAALDVFWDEPYVPQPLLALENVVLTPHFGSGTRETRRRMAELAMRNVEQFVRTAELLTPILAD